MLHGANSRVLKGHNPFDVAWQLDYFQGPRNVALWNETWFFSTWSPENETGIFIHAGADASDPELYYAQVIAYLPGNELICERAWGRPKAGNLVVGGFSITTEEPLRRWRLTFNGAGERTNSHLSGRGPVGAGFAVPMNFDIMFSAAAPIWDLFAASGIPHADWAGLHHEQTTYSHGQLSVAGKTWDVKGYGFRDHSTGTRDFSSIGADRFWGFVSPTTNRSFQGLQTWDRGGALAISSAAYFVDDTFEIINDSEIGLTGCKDTFGNPKDLELKFKRPNGEVIVASGKVLHTLMISIADPNHNLNGVWLEGNPLILAECQVRFDWPDGDFFYGHLERVVRLADLKLP